MIVVFSTLLPDFKMYRLQVQLICFQGSMKMDFVEQCFFIIIFFSLCFLCFKIELSWK